MKKKVPQKHYLGVFTYQDAINQGMTRREIDNKLKSGIYVKLSRGQYIDMEALIPLEQIDFVVSYYKFKKKSVISGLTALFYHGLIEQAPHQIWLMVPESARTTEKKYRLIRTKKVSQKAIIDFEYFKIANIERSIVEAFKYSPKVGIRTAVTALVSAIKANKTTMTKIMNTAKEMGLEKPLRTHWELIIGAIEG